MGLATLHSPDNDVTIIYHISLNDFLFYYFQAKCNQVFHITKSTELNVNGPQSNKYIPIELCRWSLNIKTDRNQTVLLSVFNRFSKEIKCAESMVTLRERKRKESPAQLVFFYCNNLIGQENKNKEEDNKKNGEKGSVETNHNTFNIENSGEFVFEFLRSNWQPDDGVTLKFEIQ